MSDKIRIAVWGTGNIGQAVIKLAARRDDVEVVGAFVYSDAKDGVDVGTLAGIDPLGATATTDRSAIFSLAPDAVVYTTQDVGDFRADADLLELLETGINVVTPLPYQNIGVRGPEIEAAFQKAGESGGASIFGTGINPGFMPERLALTLSGLTSEVDDVLIEEFYRIGNEPAATLNVFGFGLPAPAEGERTPASMVVEQLERQFIHFLGDTFGTPVTELNYSAEWHVAAENIQTPSMTVAAGTVGYVSHRWEGVTDGPTIRFQNHWWISDDLGPTGLPCDDYYRITIEGRPSIRVGLEMRASAKEGTRLYPGDPTEPAYYTVAATLIQAVPIVLDAAPGIKRIEPAANNHWRARLRG